MAVRVQQVGRLGDLAEIPWGTPDADRLFEQLRGEYGPAALDRAAAAGKLRELCAGAPAADTLASLLDRSQEVRHAFRGDLDWSDPAVTGVYHALTRAFDEDGASEDACRLAGLDLAGIDLGRPASEVWLEVMDRAARQGRLEKLIDHALTDVSISERQDVLEAARDRPWRKGPRPVAPTPAPSGPPAPPAAAVSVTPQSEEPAPVPRRIGPRIALLLGLGVVGLGAGVAMTRGLPREAPPELPSIVIQAGTLELHGRAGRLVLSRAGEDVATIAATSRVAFPAAPLDSDGDGRIDPTWSARLELTSSPCPARVLPLRRDHPEDQRWSVPAARAVQDVEGCRVEVSGLADLTVGSVVELDPGSVAPRRFALVEDRIGDVSRARALGAWETCAACFPAAATCADAAEVATAPADAALLLERGAGCPEAARERLEARLPPPPPATPEPPPAPKPQTRPAPRPAAPAPKKKKRHR